MRLWAALFLLVCLEALCPCLLARITRQHGFIPFRAFLNGHLSQYNHDNGITRSHTPVTVPSGSIRSTTGTNAVSLCQPGVITSASYHCQVRQRPSGIASLYYCRGPNGNNWSSDRDFALGSFFGSVNQVFTDAEYDHRLALNKKYDAITDETDDSGLPLAPENEDYEVDDSVPPEDADLTKPPTPKEEWFLKKMARGRRFWHKYFAEPSQQSLRFYRLVKMKHDMKYCNRVVKRTYTELRPAIKQKMVDGNLQKLTREERNLNRSRIRVTREVIGYDNSSEDSNILIMLTLPQKRLVHMVERIRLPHLLALRNYEMLRLLRHSMIYMAKPNVFESTVDFLLTLSRLDTSYKGDIPLFCELPSKPQKRFRPMIYGTIGRLRNDPFPDHLLKVRSSQPPPIREPFPTFEDNKNTVLTKFLDACNSLVVQRLRQAEYDYDAVMDRDFSDNFKEMMPSYCTKGSINRIDYPVAIRFSKEMAQYLREPVLPPSDQSSSDAVDHTESGDHDQQTGTDNPMDSGNEADHQTGTDGNAPTRRTSVYPPRGSNAPWTRDDIKHMLKKLHRIGLTKPSTLIDRIKRLHCEMGFSFEDILWLGRTNPQLFRYANYYNRCLELYDSDEELTFKDVLSIVHSHPAILTYNVPRTIRPKIYYIRRVMKRPIADLVNFPKALSYSLYDRIIPRHISLMNQVYKGQYLKVYRFLFQSGFYKGYGQTVTDERVPDIIPHDHARYMAVYEEVNQKADLQKMLSLSDEEFQRQFNLSYRQVAQGKEDAINIPLPTDVL
ncbi:hypothetical protein BaOVIS_015100 [Babesia ovis]|uniref:mTERF domain-containing protein 1, mitochondrial n=1 Tax=Babesia ovis TaxID=5869 RepID=A0A9W5TAI3_BABOV|nr:hypothetical protein BaOVIS_015100 [Babesia ovis]